MIVTVTCERAMSLLSAYLDRELGHDELRQVELHLAGCDRCSAECRALRATRDLVGTLKSVPLPREFWPELRIRLSAGPAFHVFPFSCTKVLVPAVLLLAMVVLPLALGARMRPSATRAHAQADTIETYFREHVISEYDRPLSDKTSIGFIATAQAVAMYSSDLLGPGVSSAHTSTFQNWARTDAPTATRTSLRSLR